MKMSQLFVQTLREFPSDAEVISHKLLVRAGFIRKLTSGVYNYLPLMWRVLKKVENIVREEMDSAGAQELLMPFVQPKELWEESGRWDVYGKELMRLKDRHNRDMCLGPTHEEVITAIAKEGIRSYKQMPVNLYQIQSKFRDEIRPRFGLLRGREFIMKDAYSFDINEKGLDKSYDIMTDAYKKIFDRCGLDTKMVQSDTGVIGGKVSHEFMVLTEAGSGENDVFYCEDCDYAANSDHAISILPEVQVNGGFEKFEKVSTPNVKTIEELSDFFKVAPSTTCKALVYIADKEPVVALIRGDKAVEETKLKNALRAMDLRIASSAEIVEIMQNNGFNAEAGFIGPLNLKGVKIVADKSVKNLENFIIGANENDAHYVGVNWGVDLELPEIVKDIRLVEEGEICVKCKKKLKVTGGIEVGNIFKLGTKYSQEMKATFTAENGAEKPFVMGCYGIGISRTAAAAVESHYDDYGIKWPISIAPYHVYVVPVGVSGTKQFEVATEIYDKLKNAGVEVIFDDRDERPGVKFKDADLIGIPYRITVGKTIEQGLVEFKVRETSEMTTITPDEAVEKIISIVKNVK